MDARAFYTQLGGPGITQRPLQHWDPPLSGDMDCVIKPDGAWFIDGAAVNNRRLVALFASVLRYEQGDYYLVTPVEKWRIQVDDLPFIVVELTAMQPNTTAQIIKVRTNLGDQITVDSQHPIDSSTLHHIQPAVRIPYVHIRHGLTARFNRSTFIELAALLGPGENTNDYVLASAGQKFVLTL